eukprot:4821200-Prymnesium_polylepis.1
MQPAAKSAVVPEQHGVLSRAKISTAARPRGAAPVASRGGGAWCACAARSGHGRAGVSLHPGVLPSSNEGPALVTEGGWLPGIFRTGG